MPQSSSSSSSARSKSSTRAEKFGSWVGSSYGLNSLPSIQRWNEEARSVGVKYCHCGVECSYYTSFTDDNPGRRFYRCQMSKNGGCGFWEWFDKPTSNVDSQLLPLLRDEIISMRNELKLKEGLIAQTKTELRGVYSENDKFKEELQLCQYENTCLVEKVCKLRDEISKFQRSSELEKEKLVFLKRGNIMLLLVVVFMSMYFIHVNNMEM